MVALPVDATLLWIIILNFSTLDWKFEASIFAQDGTKMKIYSEIKPPFIKGFQSVSRFHVRKRK